MSERENHTGQINSLVYNVFESKPGNSRPQEPDKLISAERRINMGIKDFLAKTTSAIKFGKGKKQKIENLHPDTNQSEQQQDSSVLTTGASTKRRQEQSIEKLEQIEQRFTNLVGHLEGIDNNLKSFPDFVQNQNKLTQQLLEYIRNTKSKDEKVVEALENLPKQAAKQNRRFVRTVALVVGIGIIALLALMIIINFVMQSPGQ